MEGVAFAAYIRNVLVPEIKLDTVVIRDNLATNKNAEAADALRATIAPPYSPDLNPIEQAFSKLKAHLRRRGARTFSELFTAIGEIRDLFTPDECWNYLVNSGYAINVKQYCFKGFMHMIRELSLYREWKVAESC